MECKRTGWTWFWIGACAIACNACLIEGEYLPDIRQQLPGSGTNASTRVPLCGDGFRHDSESCDDGNKEPNDGCDANCVIELCFSCTDQPELGRSVCGPLCDERAGRFCHNGACVSCSDGIQNGNETDVDCGGECGPCAISQRCAGAADCSKDTFCSSGVCCNESCDGMCVRCDLPGSVGICAFVPESEAHQNDVAGLVCNGASACDGKGSCKKLLGEACAAGIECLGGKCVNGGCQ
jgi:cysteine-rich repeat protein